jgi:flagellar basal body-associated protein FliL
MATPRQPSRPPVPARNGWWVALFIVLGAVPVVLALTLAWFEYRPSGPGEVPKPLWVVPEIIRATTTDGTPVKTKVAIDVTSDSAKFSIERKLNQVGLVLQTSLGSKSRQELTGPKGLQLLSQDMLQKLNAYLTQEDIEPAKAVAIQDFLIGTP